MAKDDTFWTVVTDGMSKKEFDAALDRIASGDPLLSDGLLEDGILITGMPTGLAKEGLTKASDYDSDNEDIDTPAASGNSGSASHVFGIANAQAAYDAMVKYHLVNSLQKETGSSKHPPILTPEILSRQNKRALISDPNYSGVLCFFMCVTLTFRVQSTRFERHLLTPVSWGVKRCLGV